MEQVTDGVYRLGSKWINFFLVVDGDAITLIDSGMPGYADQLQPALAELDRGASDVKAIVLTHTHSDHVGGMKAFSESTGAPVFVHRDEASFATGAEKPGTPKGIAGSLWRPTMLRFVGHFAANGGTKTVTVPSVREYTDGDVLDVPGKPRVIYSPGHSRGHCALVLEGHRVLFCGDALATLAVTTGETGPMLHPFNDDQERAIESLSVLSSPDALFVLPGHGEPFRGSPADAVRLARERLHR